MKHEITTPIIHITILELRDFDYESILSNPNQKGNQGIHIGVQLESSSPLPSSLSKSNSKKQYQSTNSRPCAGVIDYHDSLFLVSTSTDILKIQFEVRSDEGYRETILGTGEYLFHGEPYVGLLQINEKDQTTIGVLLFEIR